MLSFLFLILPRDLGPTGQSERGPGTMLQRYPAADKILLSHFSDLRFAGLLGVPN